MCFVREMLTADGAPVTHRRVLKKALSHEDVIPRIPPNSSELFESTPWLNIMADIAITAAIAEMKVSVPFGCPKILKLEPYHAVTEVSKSSRKTNKKHDRSPKSFR